MASSCLALLCAEPGPGPEGDVFGGAPVAPRDPALLSDPRVLQQLLGLEHYYLPAADYLATSPGDMQPYMRRVLATWMLEVCEEQCCEEQVFPLAISLLDRYLACSPVQRCHLQLLGSVCLLTSSKLRQCRALSVDLLVYYTDYSVTAEQIRVWEMLLLAKLQWDVNSVTAFDFVDHLLERLPLSGPNQPPQRLPQLLESVSVKTPTSSVPCNNTTNTLRSHALTYVTLCYTESEFIQVRPSLIAAASIGAALGVKHAEQATLLAKTVEAEVGELAVLIQRVEQLMSAQLTAISHQQSQQQQQQVSSTNKLSTTHPKHSSHVESDGQPETPTDVQDIHF